MNTSTQQQTDDYGNPLTFTSSPKKQSQDATDDFPPPVPFPLDALNNAQRRAVLAVSRTYQQDPALAGMVSLGGLSGAIGRSFMVQGASSHSTYANVFVVCAAERSYGKGSSSAILSAIVQRNSELQLKYREHEAPSLKASIQIAEGEKKAALREKKPHQERIKELQQKIDAWESQLKTSPAILIGSATGAALWETLGRNREQLLSYSPEAGDLVRVALGRYSKDDHADFDLLLSGFSCEPISETRVGRGTKHLAHPCISACWLLQPSLLSELLGHSEVLERGLAARCLYVSIPQTTIQHDNGSGIALPPEEIEVWNRILNTALDHRDNETQPLACDEDAREAFRAFHNETVDWRNTHLKDIQGEFGRARENAIRLALGQCIADACEQLQWPPTNLTIDHARRGIALARFSIDQFLRLLSPAREAKRKARLLRVIEICRDNGGTVTLRDLRLRNGFSDHETEALAATYPMQLEVITKATTAKGGRPSRLLAYKPLLQPI